MKVLNVALNNTAAETIVRHLVGDLSTKGSVFETEVGGEPWHMKMTSVSGHIMEYRYKNTKYNPFNCEEDKLVPLFTEDVEKYVVSTSAKVTLETDVKKCDNLIIWTNESRDAENIANEVIEVCQAVNPNVKIHRAKFTELTAQSVRLALETLTEPDKNISDAIDVRIELDFRTGRAFSRFQTLCIRSHGRPEYHGPFSYGSCQLAALSFVVDWWRQTSLQALPSQTTKVLDNRNGISVEFESLVNVAEFDSLTVTKVSCNPIRKPRPSPLNILELVKYCSCRFELSAKQTMNIALNLCNRGLVSSPETTSSCKRDLEYLVRLQTHSPEWGTLARRVLDDGLSPQPGIQPFIYPMEYTDTLKGNERRLYEFVVYRFLACLSSDDDEFEETIVTATNVSGGLFEARGIRIAAPNYPKVFGDFVNVPIHQYKEEQVFRPRVKAVNATSQPRKPLTETELFAYLVEHHIGTISTHANHIETIRRMKYVSFSRDDGFLPTLLGLGIYTAYERLTPDLVSLDYRGKLEADLTAICEGERDKEDVLQKHLMRYHEVMAHLLAHRKEWEQVFWDVLRGEMVGKSSISSHNMR